MQTYSEIPGHNFALTATFEEIDVKDYHILVIPGGRAPEYLSINDGVISMVKAFASLGRPIASICHGQLILASAGLLDGKKCTAYPALKPTIDAAGGIWLEPQPITSCFADGKLITGAAWPGHPQFLNLALNALGAKISNADKKVLFICGVILLSCWEHRLPVNEDR
jgi:D-lactate dehydratase